MRNYEKFYLALFASKSESAKQNNSLIECFRCICCCKKKQRKTVNMFFFIYGIELKKEKVALKLF